MRDRGGRFSPVPVDDKPNGRMLLLPQAVVLEIERLLRSYGDGEDNEGIVYLGGLEVGECSVALTALSPTATTSWGSFNTGVEANTEVVRSLASLSLTLVGQVHSHPGFWVDHSDGDDQGALVRFPGYWSIVVPVFAKNGILPLEQCGVHLYERGQFWRLTKAALEGRVRVLPASMDLRKLNG
jgi:hypothetical protein